MTDSLSVDAIATHLRCPRRYEFAHVHEIAGAEEGRASERRLERCRDAICAALATADPDPDRLERVALDRLATTWADREERFHSIAQQRHERRLLEATVRAFVETFEDHVRGVATLAEGLGGDGARQFVGPRRTLSTGIPVDATAGGERAATDDGGANVPDSDGGTRAPDFEDGYGTDAIAVEAPVDYCYRDGASLVGVRFVPALRHLGLLRYRSSWEGDVEACVSAHFDPDEDRFEPGPVAVLLETAVALDGLRALRDRLGIGAKTCRYRYVALAERSNVRVNWVREDVRTSLESVDLTDVFVDHHAFGMHLEHRNPTLEARLADVVAAIVDGAHDPGDRWETIAAHCCGRCDYAVCCPEYVASEVAFDG